MKKVIKKQYVILSFTITFIVILGTAIVFNEKMFQAKEKQYSNINIVKYDILNNVNNILFTQNLTNSTLNTTQDVTIANTETENQVTSKQEEQQKPTTTKKINSNTQTKDKSNKTEIPTSTNISKDNVNTSKNNSNTTVNNNSQTKPVENIKKISKSELDTETKRYLKDIQKIKPGLKYVKKKRGQVFWPYRTNEITVAVGNVSFGTIYYYVDKYTEGNVEKFKYYIDWEGI